MQNKLNNLRRSYRRVLNSLAALKQDNMSLKQMPHLVRDRRLWFQLLSNIREIEGSWLAAIRRTLLMYEGHPRKRDRPW
jgi:hypothetical protein